MYSIEDLCKMYLLVFFTMSFVDDDQQSNPYSHHLKKQRKVLFF